MSVFTNSSNNFPQNSEFSSSKVINNSFLSKKQGIIICHGEILDNEICRIPDNIYLFMPVPKNVGFSFNDIKIRGMQNIENRGNIVLNSTAEKGRIIPQQTVIQDMLLQFYSVFDINKNIPDDPTKIALYSYTGIITSNLHILGQLNNSTSTSKFTPIYTLPPDYFNNKSKTQNLINKIKRDSLKSHNNSIISNIWGKQIRLSEILYHISIAYKNNNSLPQLYHLYCCRNIKLNGNVTYRSMPPKLIRDSSKSSPKYFEDLYNFCEKIEEKLKHIQNLNSNITSPGYGNIIILINKIILVFKEKCKINIHCFNFLYYFLKGNCLMMIDIYKEYSDNINSINVDYLSLPLNQQIYGNNSINQQAYPHFSKPHIEELNNNS